MSKYYFVKKQYMFCNGRKRKIADLFDLIWADYGFRKAPRFVFGFLTNKWGKSRVERR